MVFRGFILVSLLIGQLFATSKGAEQEKLPTYPKAEGDVDFGSGGKRSNTPEGGQQLQQDGLNLETSAEKDTITIKTTKSKESTAQNIIDEKPINQKAVLGGRKEHQSNSHTLEQSTSFKTSQAVSGTEESASIGRPPTHQSDTLDSDRISGHTIESKPCLPTEAPKLQNVQAPPEANNVEQAAHTESVPAVEESQVKDASKEPSLPPPTFTAGEVKQGETEKDHLKVVGGVGQREENHLQGQKPDQLPSSTEVVSPGSDSVKGVPVASENVAKPETQPSVPDPTETPALSPDQSSHTETVSAGIQEGQEKSKEGAEKKSEEAAKKEEDEIKAPTKDGDMPSFDEWKQKMLAEQQEQERSKLLEAMASPPSSPSATKLKTNKKSSNYASASCGAKVLATNSETQNPGFILTENKDQYMINPCKARKWFVVELCEPVQIHSLEMGNLELFSSLPASFVAQMSDRYPPKEWNHLGTFHARDQRSIQSFAVGDEQLFAKYIKLEIKSHYGSEHYCPLSILRVYGVTVEDDDGEDVDHHHEAESVTAGDSLEEAALPATEDDAPTNLFASAKDTVLSIVKNVLGPGGKKEEEQVVTKDIEQLNHDLKANASAKNISSDLQGDDAKDPMLPCPPNANSVAPSPSDGGPVSGTPDQPETPAVTVPNQSQSESSVPPAPITDPPRVFLMEGPIKPLKETLNMCDFCSSLVPHQCMFKMQSICGYYRLWRFVPPTCCLDAWHSARPFKPDVVDEPVMKIDDDKRQPPEKTGGKADNHQEVTVPAVTTTDRKSSSDTTSSLVRSEAIHATKTESHQEATKTISVDVHNQNWKGVGDREMKASRPDEILQPSHNLHVSSDSSGQHTGTANLPPTISTVPNSHTLNVPADSCEDGTSGDMPCQLGPDVVQIRPTSTEDASASSKEVENMPSQSVEIQEEKPNKKPEEKDNQPESMSSKSKNTQKEDAQIDSNNGNGAKVIFADEKTEGIDFDQDSLPPPTGEEINYQKLGRKETTYMRLKNKIKMLELNLNLSSRYLEELSQRYKRQMEDMYLSLNRTIARLANTSKAAETRDLKQQERIAFLEKQVDGINSFMVTLKDDMASVHSQVIERHLFLMFVEAVIFSCILAWCLARQKNMESLHWKTAAKVEHFTKSVKEEPPESKNTATDKKKVSKQSEKKRRNSIDACTPPRERSSSFAVKTERTSYDDTDLYTQGRENDFTIIEPNIPIFISDINKSNAVPDITNAQKKKKKKKQKPLGMVCGANLLGKHPVRMKSSQANAEVTSGVQDVPETTIDSNASSLYSSTNSLTSNTSSSSNFHKEHPPTLFNSNSCAKQSNSRKYTARKSLDSALSNNKGHKHTRSNGTPPTTNIEHFNGHAGMTEDWTKLNSSSMSQIGVCDAAGQPVNGSMSGTERPQQSGGWGVKGWFHKYNGRLQ